MTILSLCIATYNRACFIPDTLASIVDQLSPGVEVVIVDGASPDDTAAAVAPFVAQNSQIRYMREAENSGVDADYDKAVLYARGTHCWLLSDDDVLAPGAIAAVLAELELSDPDLLVVDAEVRDRDLKVVFESRRLGFQGRRTYGANDADRMLKDLGDALTFIGCVVIRRTVWTARDRRAYYGSLFIHVGVILQAPLQQVTALGISLVRIRIGNALWTARGFQIWMFLWPEMVWSFPGFSNAAKEKVVSRQPWRQPQKLLVLRAHGVYGVDQYRSYLRSRVSSPSRALMYLIAILPGRFAHIVVIALLTLRGHARASSVYQLVEGSRFSNSFSRWISAAAAMER